MAWNETPAKDDPNLSLQAYYVRPNVLQSMLKPVSRAIFQNIWNAVGAMDSGGLRKADFVGDVVADLIRGLGLVEISESSLGPGDWFVHSGVTRYHPRDAHSGRAEIKLASGKTVVGVVRHDCRITNSASVNMSGDDDVSFVVGRLLTSEKFDLVVAGYRDPFAFFSRGLDVPRIFDVTQGGDLSQMVYNKPWASRFKMRLDMPDAEALAEVIGDVMESFAAAVGRQGAWKLLYGRDGRPLHESHHQGMFRLFSQLPFGALGIHVEPNADHGSGPTDFTLRLNDSVNIIEFKKDDKKEEIRHGLAVQLPNYMESAGAGRGTYVVMCHSREKEDVYRLLAEVIDSDPTLPDIDCCVIDCRPKTSASKARSRYPRE
ncbi:MULTISPECIES: hypothetical protein [Streptomyces]|uniref:PD-(D/E)XK nuclease superfamily protein n=1 Tax=Streptomyces malaysiensis subsp. samsunensis TaxID=459658 RepID=A0A9X2M402_STRMQ|nr:MULTISPECIES: hypothetical protein [Streptomyces]MCQ8835023.1 hypothetical protein [Streptomyces samsunensis]QTI89016.1 hypothetical protein AS97_51155 [Streptomyces sp. AgN23]